MERYGAEGEINWSLDKAKPIAAPAVKTPVKATERQKKPAEEDGPVTEILQNKGGQPIEDQFEGLDDADALEALEAVEKSSAAGGD